MKVSVNKTTHDLTGIDPSTPLLWVLRDHLNLVGTKFGCGISQCGACTVLIDDTAVKSCIYPISAVGDKDVTTIEGLASDEEELTPLQQAWVDVDVAQCGYCQAGQIMATEALLRENSNPTDADINTALAGNLCRCGTYLRVREAVKVAAKQRS
ncbi:MAG: (2Fe-2S)-binding protein [Gammaproteobacteria bacterium]|nr:(2Fe-2S)-binding protein [Gammaproteobacteria bacterium]MDE0251590.1 (2Fe-2S)-binding protein [Gammaproteobacteria bacterium]MDE0403400.1 (2Fe-2S)-binding protein [Gammaproteobacteria bacterium]